VARLSVAAEASDLRLNGREFDPRPLRYRSVGTGMGDRLRAGIPPRYVTNHPGKLGLLPSVGRGMSTGQSAVMRCGCGDQSLLTEELDFARVADLCHLYVER